MPVSGCGTQGDTSIRFLEVLGTAPFFAEGKARRVRRRGPARHDACKRRVTYTPTPALHRPAPHRRRRADQRGPGAEAGAARDGLRGGATAAAHASGRDSRLLLRPAQGTCRGCAGAVAQMDAEFPSTAAAVVARFSRGSLPRHERHRSGPVGGGLACGWQRRGAKGVAESIRTSAGCYGIRCGT